MKISASLFSTVRKHIDEQYDMAVEIVDFHENSAGIMFIALEDSSHYQNRKPIVHLIEMHTSGEIVVNAHDDLPESLEDIRIFIRNIYEN